MKKVLNFVKGKKDDKGSSKINPQISVEITNPSGQKIPSDDEHIIGNMARIILTILHTCMTAVHSWNVKFHPKSLSISSGYCMYLILLLAPPGPVGTAALWGGDHFFQFH